MNFSKQIANQLTSLSGWLTITRQDKLKFLTGFTRFTGLVEEKSCKFCYPDTDTDTDSYRYRYRGSQRNTTKVSTTFVQ